MSAMRLVHYYRQWDPRLRVFYMIFACVFVFLVTGLAWRQLINQDEYREKEDRQILRRIIQPGPRGRIMDRHGNVLVDNRPRYSAVVSLRELRREFQKKYAELRDAREAAHVASGSEEPFRFDWGELQWESRLAVLQSRVDQINEILGTDHQLTMNEVQQHFGHRLLMPFPLMSDVEPEQYAKLIEQLPLGSDIFVYTDTAREYPYGEAAAHTLGYVVSPKDMKVDAPELPGEELKTFSYRSEVGRSGLERAFDEQLRGEAGGQIWVVDRFQFQYDEPMLEKAARPGKDLIVSLDLPMQLAAEKALQGKTGAVAAVDVNTGEVLVIASLPSYDLNDLSPSIPQKVFDDINERGAWLNRAIQGLYPPGSTFKILTGIAALREGTVTEREVIHCGSHYPVGRRLFPEHSGRSFGDVDLSYALQKSSNVYFYQVGLKTGIDAIAAEARRFGLDQPTGVELPFESTRMVVPDMQWKRETQGFGWVPGDTANVSIGQGYLLFTPLQMAAFTASLARGETRTKLTLLHDPERGAVDHGGEPIGLTEEQYSAIIEGMERAVGPDGTARFGMVKGLRIAGKTGTAQVTSKGEPMTLAWFVGFAPIENPQVAIAVCVEGTTSGDNYAGGLTAAPIAKAVLEAWLKQQEGNTTLATTNY